MSTNKQDRAKQNLLKQIEQLPNFDPKPQIHWLLRCWFLSLRQTQQAGFVLPTVVLVLLVVGLTVAALLFRSLSRTTQVIGQREQQEIYNAATPAIDRAKAKLEYLFKDGKLPSGIPPEGKLVELMQDDVYNFPGKNTGTPPIDQKEYRLNLDGNTATTENAWMYRDAEGNTIAYSILMKAEDKTVTPEVNVKTADPVTKANNLVVRSGPVSTVQPSSACANAGASALEQGWFKDNVSTGFLRKNFQVNAVVLTKRTPTDPNKPITAATTLEFQQERQVDRGNKWGAWFLNDLEIFPGPEFNWNGSMHTEGSIFLGSNQDQNKFRAYLISAPNSCLYGTDGLEASEISMKDQPEVLDPSNPAIIKIPRFQGQIISGSMKENSFSPSGGTIDRSPNQNTTLSSTNDSVQEDTAGATKLPVDIALDALSLFTEDKSQARKASDPKNTTARDTTDWDDSNLLAHGTTQRVFNKTVTKPYVDDSYRADNRYGPKLPKGGLPTTTKVGDAISSSNTELVSNAPIAGNLDNVGLDGYWERRTRNQGLRIIVGQRLELGSPLALPTLSPITTSTRHHEALQRLTLRDNLAAVQATAIYFHEDDPVTGNNEDVPVACLATTVHPGTADSLKNSATFRDVTFNTGAAERTLKNDFFTGRGTNGWEYTAPSAGGPNAAQLIALRNLANFSGDPNGAFPPRQEASTSTVVHPYPLLTQYGDFSNLRRALTNLAGSSYADLSIADKSYIDTANCSLGMLADEIKKLKDYSYTDATNVPRLATLNTTLSSATYSGTPEEVTTKLFIANLPIADTAWLVYLKEQVDRDRRNNVGYTCAIPATYTNIRIKLCPTVAKYEALSYIFPTANRTEGRTDTYLNSTGVNPSTLVYQGIGGTTYNDANDNTALESIRLTPKSIADWKLDPALITTPGANAPNDKTNSLIKYVTAGGVASVYRIPFKDTALFNGREMMNVRVLNIDLDLLRQNRPYAADSWLPASGLVYAFREDAVREDGIARPALGTWADYKNVWDANTTSGPPQTNSGTPSRIWRMDAVTPKDPPLNGSDGNGAILAGGTGISPKPIDYYPDPARRPYGFRLKQGTILTRTVTSVDNTFGMSFISDNPVYIQGDFNLHRNSSGTLLEEFTQTLTYGAGGFYSNFYARTTTNTEFAKPAIDSWRPTEIIADAITILSNSFCDGSVQDGLFVATSPAAPSGTTTVSEAQYGCGTGNIATSYLNQNRPSDNITYTNWLRENPADPTSPIAINNNGAPRISPATAYGGGYQAFTDGKQKNTASVTRINAILISGLVPSRQQQAYGGLHNFPRFLETWNPSPRIDLYLSGSFIQLNFSTSATAPFDQDSWEKLDTSDSAETIPYYGPPNRRWGYDVALQFQAPGSISQRFTSVSSVRSEFYRELPVDDPYIRKLRCATIGTTSDKVDPKCS